jgi:hypothetical protein
MIGRDLLQSMAPGFVLVFASVLMTTAPAAAFCIRNDTGATIQVEATDDSAVFQTEIANNKKSCCSPKDEACGITKKKVQLSISSPNGEATCEVAVSAKGNVNVTGNPKQLKCKANKAGSTMDWASG